LSTTTGADGIETVKTIYHVETPEVQQKTTIFTPWTGTVTATVATDISTSTGANGIETVVTIYHVQTPEVEVATTVFTPWTGRFTSTYSTRVTSIVASNEEPQVNIIYYVETPVISASAFRYSNSSSVVGSTIPSKSSPLTFTPGIVQTGTSTKFEDRIPSSSVGMPTGSEYSTYSFDLSSQTTEEDQQITTTVSLQPSNTYASTGFGSGSSFTPAIVSIPSQASSSSPELTSQNIATGQGPTTTNSVGSSQTDSSTNSIGSFILTSSTIAESSLTAYSVDSSTLTEVKSESPEISEAQTSTSNYSSTDSTITLPGTTASMEYTISTVDTTISGIATTYTTYCPLSSSSTSTVAESDIITSLAPSYSPILDQYSQPTDNSSSQPSQLQESSVLSPMTNSITSEMSLTNSLQVTPTTSISVQSSDSFTGKENESKHTGYEQGNTSTIILPSASTLSSIASRSHVTLASIGGFSSEVQQTMYEGKSNKLIVSPFIAVVLGLL
ncbi:hypothetical protein C6P43_001044, partial [Kluyveromyces marxianus]